METCQIVLIFEVTLSSIYGKLFDTVLFRYGKRLLSSELQFGFKAKCSTNLFSTVLKESWRLMSNIKTLSFVRFSMPRRRLIGLSTASYLSCL